MGRGVYGDWFWWWELVGFELGWDIFFLFFVSGRSFGVGLLRDFVVVWVWMCGVGCVIFSFRGVCSVFLEVGEWLFLGFC